MWPFAIMLVIYSLSSERENLFSWVYTCFLAIVFSYNLFYAVLFLI